MTQSFITKHPFTLKQGLIAAALLASGALLGLILGYYLFANDFSTGPLLIAIATTLVFFASQAFNFYRDLDQRLNEKQEQILSLTRQYIHWIITATLDDLSSNRKIIPQPLYDLQTLIIFHPFAPNLKELAFKIRKKHEDITGKAVELAQSSLNPTEGDISLLEREKDQLIDLLGNLMNIILEGAPMAKTN